MSSIMRRRSGLMAISVIGGSCLEDEVANSSILKTRRRPHHHPFTSRRSSRALPCAQRPPARAGSFGDPERTCASVSTGEQSLDLQRDALERTGCERIYDVGCSGRDRPGLSKALDAAREGDALVVWKLDRIG